MKINNMVTKRYETPTVDVKSMVVEQFIAASVGTAGFEKQGNNDLGDWEII